jgi:alpha-ketoglutarate-dependent taurine dioxygenase
VTNLPEVDPHIESTQKNNLVTAVLKRLFGSVFQHFTRGPDETFKIMSYYQASADRILELPNYDTNEILLPHTDHSHYDNPVRVQGFHTVQRRSENTFIHAWSCLQTLRDEDPEAYESILSSPRILGRVAQFYAPPLFQTTVDCAVRKKPGFPDRLKCIRWHPHLAGYPLTPFEEYERARAAHVKFEEIMYQDSHMIRTELKPGDMYIWDNFRILHGREKVFETPRLAVGQTVIEQDVNDQYRVVKMAWLTRYIPETWLVQTPTHALEDLIQLVKSVTKDEVTF